MPAGPGVILHEGLLNLQKQDDEITKSLICQSQVSFDAGWEPLPAPVWGDVPETLEFPSTEAFEVFSQELHNILGTELQDHPYNTVGNFLNFYEEFKRRGSPPLWEFYQQYDTKIIPNSLSCVGLGCCLIEHIINSPLGHVYPELRSALYLASCEEMVLDVESYCSSSPPKSDLVVKEHVLVALKISIHNQMGVIILDPGYHVGIPVVIMGNGAHPHTGWFLQSETPKSKKEYCYVMKGDYVLWITRETRNNTVKKWDNLIYIRKRFLSHITVAEKRNLVFNFRTLVARDRSQPVAGFYCNLKGEERFTLFFRDGGGKRVEVKIPFEYFQGCRSNNMFEASIEKCASQAGFNVTYMAEMMTKVVEAYNNSHFMPYVNELNRLIDEEDEE